jgi:hypothetical protein
MKLLFAVTTLLLAVSSPLAAQDIQIVGMYRLISEERTIVATGEVIPTKGVTGSITYTADGRMLVLIVREPRPKPDKVENLTDQLRANLFRTMTAYGGTYTFDGKTVQHHIDISWNGAWTGTTQIRNVTKEGERLVYTSHRPNPFSGDGKMSVVKLVWEKVK